jgi:Tol biopolymer transport system component
MPNPGSTMKRLNTSGLILEVLFTSLTLMASACGGGEPQPQPEPLLVPWEQLSGRIAYMRSSVQNSKFLSEILVIDAAARKVTRVYSLTEDDGLLEDLAWHPSGGSIAVSKTTFPPSTVTAWVTQLLSVDVPSGRTTELYTYPDVMNRHPAWSRDGRLAYEQWAPGTWTDSLCIDGHRFLTAGYCFDTRPTWSSDGSTLAFAGDNPALAACGMGPLTLADVTTGTTHLLGPSPIVCRDPAYSPDGSRIAFEYFEGGLWVVNADGTGLRHVPAPDGLRSVAWSPDGSSLIAVGVGGGKDQLFLINVETGQAVQLTSNGGDFPAWIP